MEILAFISIFLILGAFIMCLKCFFTDVKETIQNYKEEKLNSQLEEDENTSSLIPKKNKISLFPEYNEIIEEVNEPVYINVFLRILLCIVVFFGSFLVVLPLIHVLGGDPHNYSLLAAFFLVTFNIIAWRTPKENTKQYLFNNFIIFIFCILLTIFYLFIGYKVFKSVGVGFLFTIPWLLTIYLMSKFLSKYSTIEIENETTTHSTIPTEETKSLTFEPDDDIPKTTNSSDTGFRILGFIILCILTYIFVGLIGHNSRCASDDGICACIFFYAIITFSIFIFKIPRKNSGTYIFKKLILYFLCFLMMAIVSAFDLSNLSNFHIGVIFLVFWILFVFGFNFIINKCYPLSTTNKELLPTQTKDVISKNTIPDNHPMNTPIEKNKDSALLSNVPQISKDTILTQEDVALSMINKISKDTTLTQEEKIKMISLLVGKK